MTDRHELTESNVDRLADPDLLGVYMLYNSRDGPPRYVGRSSDLRSALIDHVDDYRLFWADAMPNRTEAYKKQVELFHFNGETEELDNERHPQRPHKNVKCKLCDVHG